jgi:serine protease AprX
MVDFDWFNSTNQMHYSLALCLAFAILVTGDVFNNKIADRVLRDLSMKSGTSILIHMKQQVDFDIVRKDGKLAREMSDVPRGYFVMNSLMENAAQTQKPILSILSKNGLKATAFWAQNSVTVKNVPKALVHVIALRDDVEFIGSDEVSELDLPSPREDSEAPKADQDTIEWNVKWVNADKLWDLGFDGKGIVVGGADTGIEFNHSALVGNYRGKTGDTWDHNYNWWDGVRDFNPCRSRCGCSIREPCDDHAHGTHTLGTAVGGVSKKIGVAPGAKWIGCRPFTDSGRHYSVTTFLACLQFFLAPTDLDGKAPKPELRPHSTVHSYGCNAQLGCPGVRDLEDATNALRASGVLMVVCAHNQGSRCSSITRQPGLYFRSIVIGATGQQTDVLAPYSSRGPVTHGGRTYIKPDITAPGTNVMSATLRNQFTTMS